MKVLVVGGGGREHALCWALAASPLVERGGVRAGQCRDRRRGALRAGQGRRHRRAGGAGAGRAASGWSWSGRRCRWCWGWSTGCGRPGSRRSGRRRRRHGSRAPRRSPRRSAPGTASRPPLRAASGRASGRRRAPMSRRRARPIVVKADGLAAGKGVVVAATVEEALAAIDARATATRRGRGVPGGRGGQPVRALRRHDRARDRHRPGPQARLRRRPGAEHRRHGRLLARRRWLDAGHGRAGHGRDRPADAAPAWRPRARRSPASSMPG